MYLAPGLVVVVALVWAITAMAARPRGDRGGRAADRRLAHLRMRPEAATRLDLEAVLRSHPLPETTVARVLRVIVERRTSYWVAWQWADRYGADKLVLALDADVADRRMRRHLEVDTVPDWEAMSVFADLNRLPPLPSASAPAPAAPSADGAPSFDAADWEVLPAPGTQVPEVDLSQFGHLPPIYDPGLPVTRSATPPPGARPPLADELDPEHPRKTGGDWPQVA